MIVRPGMTTTNYEIWRGRKPNVRYFRSLALYVIYIFFLSYDQPKKFDPMSDECIFLGYYRNSCVYCVFSKQTKSMMESINVVVNDNPDIAVNSIDEDVLLLVHMSRMMS